jgi:hypothetical protein
VAHYKSDKVAASDLKHMPRLQLGLNTIEFNTVAVGASPAVESDDVCKLLNLHPLPLLLAGFVPLQSVTGLPYASVCMMSHISTGR